MSDDLNGEFSVIIPDVAQKVCEIVTKMPWPIVLEMKSGEVSVRMDGIGCADRAPLTLTFANDLSIGESGEEEGGAAACNPPCEHGTCSAGSCVCNGLWTGPSCSSCPGGAQGGTCCAHLIDGVCCMWSAADSTSDGLCCQEGGSCCPNDSPGYSEDFGRCCRADELAFKLPFNSSIFCCPIGSSGFSAVGWRCCLAPDIMVSAGEYAGSACCPAGSTGYTDRCCTGGEVYLVDESNYFHCCPAGSTGFSVVQWACCGAAEALMPSREGMVCCPIGSPGFAWGEGRCCAAGQVVVPAGWGDTCCPAGSTGYGTRCCTEIEIAVPNDDWEGYVCCPLGTTHYQEGACH